MNPEQLYHLLKGEPFQTKRVHLKDGRTYDIPLRELVVVGVNFIDIGIQAPDELPGICQGLVSFAHEDLLRVEMLPSQPTPLSN
jgi:hypothetical protein